MTLDEMKAYLDAHGAEPCYTIGGLGGGEIDGIEYFDGAWYTYFSERGSKNSYRQWPTEEDAVAFIVESAESCARHYGLWKDTA